jgi:hypothetical protein
MNSSSEMTLPVIVSIEKGIALSPVLSRIHIIQFVGEISHMAYGHHFGFIYEFYPIPWPSALNRLRLGLKCPSRSFKGVIVII